MVKITIPNLAGTVVLFMLYVGMYPVIDVGLQIILPHLGTAEAWVARGIPFFLLLAIIGNIFEGEEVPGG